MNNRSGASELGFWGDADESEALNRYRTLVNAIDDGIYQLDSDGRFVAVNDVIVETTGYTRAELLGEHVSLLLDTTDVSAIEHEIERRLAGADDGRGTIELTILTADGDRVPCELRLNLLVEDGEFRGTIGVIRDVTDRRRAERTLTERERRIEFETDLTDRILKASPVGILVLDGEGRVEELNERARDILDVSESEWEVYSPSDRDVYDEQGRPVPVDDHPFARALKTGEAMYDRILQVERPDGECRWLSVNAEPILNDDGDVEHVVTTGEDITDIKERERELEDELTEVLGRVTDAFYALDDEWRITYVNERAEDLIDYSDEGLVGRDFWKVFEWATDSTLGEEYRIAMETQEPTSFEFYYPEPLESWYEIHAYPSETGLSVYFRDVTDRKQRERALREREEQLSRLMDNVPGMVYRCRNERGWPMEFVSDACRELTGYDPDALERGDIEWGEDVIVEDDREDIWQELQTAVTDGEPFSVTYRIETAEGDLRWVRDYGRGVFDDEGELVTLEGIISDVTERKRLESELAESERRYRTLAEYFPNGFVTLFDHDFEYTLAAGRGFEDIPVEPDDLEGRSYRDVWDEDIADALEPAFEAALDGEERSVELTYAGREWVVRAVPVTDERGDVFAGMTMAQDITERKERERSLREAKSQLEAAAEAGAVGTWEWHVREDRVVAGSSLARTFGMDPEAAREGVSLDRFVSAIHEDDRERVERKIAAAVESCGEYESEYRVRNTDGELRWVAARGRAECDENGDPVTLPGAITDITERKRAERALHENEKQLRTLLRLLPVGVIVAEADGRLAQKNDTAEEIWGGFSEAQVVADYEQFESWWPDSGDPVEPEEWPLTRALRGEEVTDSEVIEIEGFDGERRTVLFHSMPIRDADGDVTRAVVTLTDVTGREERRRRLQEQNERLESFASMLAHELRNPVAIGQIYSKQLPDADSEAVGYVAEAFDRIEDMVDILLMMTRGQEAVDESRPVSLADAAEAAWDEVGGAGGFRVETDDEIRADETYVRHLFRNLLENAVHHGGSDVTVTVGELPTGFYVADDGRGIPLEDRDSVFEMGFTTAEKSGGTGLGLAFVGELAEVYEWTCALTESADGGARFEFRNVDSVPDQ